MCDWWFGEMATLFAANITIFFAFFTINSDTEATWCYYDPILEAWHNFTIAFSLCRIMMNQKCQVQKLPGDQPQMQLKVQQNVQHLRLTQLVIHSQHWWGVHVLHKTIEIWTSKAPRVMWCHVMSKWFTLCVCLWAEALLVNRHLLWAKSSPRINMYKVHWGDLEWAPSNTTPSCCAANMKTEI